MWSCEHSLTTVAAAEAVWALYSNPRSWPSWDQPRSTVRFDSAFAEGARGTLTPADGRATTFTLVAVEPGVGYTDRTRLGTTRVEVSHRITPAAAGILLTHRVAVTGPFSRLLGSFVGQRISRQQAGALARLVALVEAD